MLLVLYADQLAPDDPPQEERSQNSWHDSAEFKHDHAWAMAIAEKMLLHLPYDVFLAVYTSEMKFLRRCSEIFLSTANLDSRPKQVTPKYICSDLKKRRSGKIPDTPLSSSQSE